MLALKGEQEGAELETQSEGQGSGEEPERTAAKNPPVYGERDVRKVDDETGEVSLGRLTTTTETDGIS